MARKNMKKVTSRRGEFYGIRERKGSSKPTVELRLPGQMEKFWGVVANVDDAKRLVKLACEYIDEEKAFPPDHPDLHGLRAFSKKEFEAFVWGEFQRNDATELLEDPRHGVDDNKKEEGMMPTNAPESSSGHSEVETCAGGAQLITLGVIRALANVVRLEHEWNVALGILRDAVQAAEEGFGAAGRSARGGYAAMLENGGLGAPPPAPIAFDAGPSETRGFPCPLENAKFGAPPVPVVSEAGQLYARGYPTMLENGGVDAPPPTPTPFAASPLDTTGFAHTLENGVLGSPSPALTAFEAGLSDTRGFAHMVAFAELDVQPTPVLLEASALYARGSIASPEHDDWFGVFFNFDEYSADAS